MANILQHSLMTDFLYPLLLVFFLVFAVLEKSKVFGDNKKQLNAGVALVIGLIFVSYVFPKLVIANLMMYMTVGLVIILCGLMLWGFVSNGEITPSKGMKTFFAWLVGITLLFAVLWATGASSGVGNAITRIFKFLFDSKSSGLIWSNFLMIAIIVIAIVVVIKKPGSGDSGSEKK